MPNTAAVWAKIAISVVTVLGSITVAFITSRVTAQTTVQDMKPIHLESGQFELNKSTQGQSILGQPPPERQLADYAPRLFQKHLQFNKPFAFTPVVRTGINSLDSGNEAHLRILVFANEVNEKGFQLNIRKRPLLAVKESCITQQNLAESFG
jgi:hypothetical protein